MTVRSEEARVQIMKRGVGGEAALVRLEQPPAKRGDAVVAAASSLGVFSPATPSL